MRRVDFVGQALGLLDCGHPGQPLMGFLELGEGDFFFEQGFALRAAPGIAVDGAAHPFSGQPVSVILAFDQDEAAVATVFGVGPEHGVGGGAAAGEGVED